MQIGKNNQSECLTRSTNKNDNYSGAEPVCITSTDRTCRHSSITKVDPSSAPHLYIQSSGPRHYYDAIQRGSTKTEPILQRLVLQPHAHEPVRRYLPCRLLPPTTGISNRPQPQCISSQPSCFSARSSPPPTLFTSTRASPTINLPTLNTTLSTPSWTPGTCHATISLRHLHHHLRAVHPRRLARHRHPLALRPRRIRALPRERNRRRAHPGSFFRSELEVV